jgi:hypothetical protein
LQAQYRGQETEEKIKGAHDRDASEMATAQARPRSDEKGKNAKGKN